MSVRYRTGIWAEICQSKAWACAPHTLAEIIRSFCADALFSTINLNVDLDIMLAALAQALLAAPRPPPRLPRRHPRHHPAPVPGNPRPDHHQQRHDHRPPGTPRLLTRPAQSRPTTRHHRPLVGQPHHPLRTRLNLAPNQLRGNPR